MQKFSKKGVLLFATAMALCAFVMPSLASAANWSPVSVSRTLDSPNIGFTGTGALGAIVSSCTNSSFGSHVNATGSALEITTATFDGCTATGAGIGTCVVDSTATRLPWTVTPTTTTNITIDGVHIDATFRQGSPANCAAAAVGQSLTITGNLAGGDWDSATSTGSFTNAEGLSSHIVGTALSNPVTVRGNFTTTGGNLTIIN